MYQFYYIMFLQKGNLPLLVHLHIFLLLYVLLDLFVLVEVVSDLLLHGAVLVLGIALLLIVLLDLFCPSC